jgi:hypothetical protein
MWWLVWGGSFLVIAVLAIDSYLVRVLRLPVPSESTKWEALRGLPSSRK